MSLRHALTQRFDRSSNTNSHSFRKPATPTPAAPRPQAAPKLPSIPEEKQQDLPGAGNKAMSAFGNCLEMEVFPFLFLL